MKLILKFAIILCLTSVYGLCNRGVLSIFWICFRGTLELLTWNTTLRYLLRVERWTILWLIPWPPPRNVWSTWKRTTLGRPRLSVWKRWRDGRSIPKGKFKRKFSDFAFFSNITNARHSIVHYALYVLKKWLRHCEFYKDEDFPITWTDDFNWNFTFKTFFFFNSPETVPRLFDLVKTKEEKILPAFYFALRDTLVANDLDQATRIAYGKTRYRVVTLQGQLLDQSGTCVGAATGVTV